MDSPVWFPNSEGTMLSALVITPDAWLNAPIVIFCRGDNTDVAVKQDREIADCLTRQGVASVLLDFAASGGRPAKLTQEMLDRPIEDLGSTLDWLRDQPGLNVGSIGVAGSDIGGTVALLRASFDPRIRSLVLRATPAPTTQLPPQPIAIPTLLLVGDDDQPILAGAKEIEQWLSGPHELRRVPHGGHHFAQRVAHACIVAETSDWFTRTLGTGLRVQAA